MTHFTTNQHDIKNNIFCWKICVKIWSRSSLAYNL